MSSRMKNSTCLLLLLGLAGLEASAAYSADNAEAWHGLVPHPRKLEGVSRWQLAYRHPRGRIYAVAWSPDGKRLAYSESCNVRICNASDFSPVTILPGHRGRIRALDWNRKADRIASASDDGTVRIWTGDGKPLASLKGEGAAVYCVAWSPDGGRLVSGGVDGKLRFYDADGREQKAVAASDTNLNCVAWSPDGKQLVTGDENHQVKLWPSDGTEGVSCEGHLGKINAVAWRPDGSRFATSTWGYKDVTEANPMGKYVVDVRIWNKDGTAVGSAVGEIPNYGMQWSGDGSSIFVVNENGMLWTIGADGENRSTQKIEGVGNQMDEPTLAVSPSGGEIALGGTGGLTIVDSHNLTKARTSVANLTGQQNLTTMIDQVTPDGKLVLVSPYARPTDTTPRTFWNLAEGKRYDLPESVRRGAASISAKGDGIASLQGTGEVALWKVGEAEAKVIGKSSGTITAVSCSPVDDRIAYNNAIDSVKIVKPDGSQVAEAKLDLSGSPQMDIGVRFLQWTPDGKHLIALSNQHFYVLASDGKLIRKCTRPNPQLPVWHSSDFTWLASRGQRKDLRIWRTKGDESIPIPDLPDDFETATFSPDASWMLFGRDTGDWEIRKSDDPGATVASALGHINGSVMNCAISDDGKRFATGGWDGDVKLWSAEGEFQQLLSDQSHPVYRVLWTPDGKRVITWSRIHTLINYSLDGGQPESVLFAIDDGSHLLVQRDGTVVAKDAEEIGRSLLVFVEKPDGRTEIVDTDKFVKQHKLAK